MSEQMIEVKAKCSRTGETTVLRVKKGTPMNEIMEAYAKKRNHDIAKIKFKMQDNSEVVDRSAAIETFKAPANAGKMIMQSDTAMDAAAEDGDAVATNSGSLFWNCACL